VEFEVEGMSGNPGQNPLEAPAVDWLFAQVPGEGKEAFQESSKNPATSYQNGSNFNELTNSFHSRSLPEPSETIRQSPELLDAYQWLQAERQRLDAYTRKQFATIQHQHQTLLAQHFRNEEALALRTQELNREMAFFAAQAKAIQERARGLAQREQALVAQTEKLSRAQAELMKIGQAPGTPFPNPDVGRILEELKTETAGLRQSEELAGGEFEGVEAALKERQEAWEKKQAEISERISQMDKRYQDLEKAEEATCRRLAEMEELEMRLEQEFAKQEPQLARERRENERLRAMLRVQGIDPDLEVPVAEAVPVENGEAV
jgi:DNA repair exonuclease SbcCD ATPase subunit